MKFKILKEVNGERISYRTIPRNKFILFITNVYAIMKAMWMPGVRRPDPQRCFSTKEEAEKHIEDWNNGTYKKTHYKEWV